ncbi:hypothetical protein AGMMS50276_17720 [Synergistales bacterium]|nr:hypothetical protein AGMMS50276_17720 [Synergistales bacterium]
MEKKVTSIALIFCLFCAALIGGVYYVGRRLTELQTEYDDLQQRKADLTQDTRSLMQQKKLFSDIFATLENYSVSSAPNEMTFYDEVRIAAQENNVGILTTKQNGVDKRTGRSSIVLSLKGNYYSFLRTLADWRNLPTTVRVSSLVVTSPAAANRDEVVDRESVQADVTLEAIISAGAATK